MRLLDSINIFLLTKVDFKFRLNIRNVNSFGIIKSFYCFAGNIYKNDRWKLQRNQINATVLKPFQSFLHTCLENNTFQIFSL